MWDANNGGVAVLVDVNRPVKKCTLTGSAARYEKEGRLLLTAIGYGHSRDVIYAMTVYGYPGAGAKQHSAFANNEALLTAAFEALATLGSVPIILGGDFNTDVEASDVLRSALGTGQYYDAIRWKSHQLGVEPEGTQKMSGNRLDYMLFNKEAFSAFYDGGTLDDPCFPVHVPVYSDLSLGSFKQQCRIRHVPAQIPCRTDLRGFVNRLSIDKADIQARVTNLHLDAWNSAVQKQDVEILFQIWCERAESCLLLEAGLPIDSWKPYTGRSHPLQPKQGYVCKRGVDNNSGAGFADAKRFSDLISKLKEILRQLNARPDNQIACFGTAILRTWCNAQALGSKLKMDTFPDTPSIPFLQQQISKCEQQLERMIKQRQQERVATWKDKLRHDWFQTRRKVFKWLRNEPFTSISLIERPDKTLTGNLMEIDELVQAAWRPIFSKYADKPEPAWSDFRARFGQYIHAAPFELSPITGEQLAAAAKKQSQHTAMGADGWRASELKRLPLYMWDQMATLLNTVEAKGRWPKTLLHAICCLIPKDTEKAGPLELRPLSIMSLLYRLWGHIRTQNLLVWQEQWLHNNARGFRKNSGTEDLFWQLAVRVEKAIISHEELYMVFASTFGGVLISYHMGSCFQFYVKWVFQMESYNQ